MKRVFRSAMVCVFCVVLTGCGRLAGADGSVFAPIAGKPGCYSYTQYDHHGFLNRSKKHLGTWVLCQESPSP